MNTAQNTNTTIGLDPFCYKQFHKRGVNFIPYPKEEFLGKMPTIYLKQKSCSYKFGTSNVTVSEENYETCRLFKKYKHQIEFRKTGNIYVSNGIANWSFDDSKFLTLKNDNGYESAILQSVDVYFNQYDDTNKPLLFVLHFQRNDGSAPQDRYYKLFRIDREMGTSRNISTLNQYSDEKSLFLPLIGVNNVILKSVTFQIDQKSNYNNRRVQLSESSNNPAVGFTKYSHTSRDKSRKKSFVLYNTDVLTDKRDSVIKELQSECYNKLNVYYGERARTTLGLRGERGLKDTVPLLIEFNKSDNPDYYVHKKGSINSGTNGVKYYWESLSGEGQELKSLLEDIGLYTKSDGRGHGTLKSLLEKASLGNGEDDLSGQLQKAKGSTLKNLLDQKVNGQKPLLVLLLERVEFNMVDSVVILVGQRTDVSFTGYNERDISGAFRNLEPSRDVNRIKAVEGVEIVLKELTNQNCVKDLNYNVMEHNFSQVVQELKPPEQKSAGLRFLIPAANSGKYKDLSLYNGSTTPDKLVYKYYRKVGTNGSKVYVVFYGDDPRPLLLCYNGYAYKPNKLSDPMDVRQVIVEYTEWIKVTDITTCGCIGDGSPNNLLETLNEVVGFLNPVQLNPKQIPKTACETITAKPPSKNTTTYELHDYTPKIYMKITRSSVGCYGKYTYEPAGTSKDGTNSVTGFRLGNVLYTDNKRTSKLHKLDYNNLGTNYKYNPLLTVHVYYYDQDKEYKDPLLVVLEFKNNGAGEEKVREYYKLTASGPSNMTWAREKDGGAAEKVGPEKIVAYLDSIRYGIKKVLKVEIHKQSHYLAMGRAAGDTSVTGSGFSNLKISFTSRNITVADCTATCTKLSGTNYKCYRHRISSISGFDYNSIAGVAFTIPGIGKTIEIKLFNITEPSDPKCTNDQSTNEVKPLTYNKCMGDVYVFFYDSQGAGGVQPAKVDTVPLMLWYNYGYYAPCDRDSYFTRWEKVSGVDGKKPPCDGGDVEELANKLAEELNNVNKALNQIDLDQSIKVSEVSMDGTGAGYGLPKGIGGIIRGGGSVNVYTSQFSTMRVALIRQFGPSQPPGNHAYVKIVHRTVNGFEIGTITYEKKVFATHGVNINGASGGTVTIKVKNGRSHTSLVTKNKWNTVVAYYSKTDNSFQFPQLMVILKTSIEVTSKPVTGSASTTYGYYILTSNGAKAYEYVWHPVTNEQVTLDSATDFKLLNSVVILLDKKGGETGCYNEDQIKEAIKTSKLSSPGREDGTINRITGKTINIADGTKGTCLNGTGFKVFKHGINELITLDESLKGLSEVKLIAGLRFLIPTLLRDDYKELSLYKENKNGINYHQSGKNIIYVFFYGSDPRPLLLCYAGSAYRPKSMSTYFRNWVREGTVQKCECTGKGDAGNGLLKTLADVSNFLNPVKLHKIAKTTPKKNTYYYVHWFNGKLIKIKVESKEADETFCFSKYTHTPDTGFRLGVIRYGVCIKENNSKKASNGDKCITSQLVNEKNSKKYNAASKVVVFYYKHDNDHKYPMVVAMGKTSDGQIKCNLYYVLKDKVAKVYKKEETNQPFNLDNDGEVTTKLDDALFSNSNKLQIIIDRIPMPKLYCPPKDETKAQVKFKCEQRKNGQPIPPPPKGSTNEKFIPPSYQAQLYDSNGKPAPNGSKPATPTSIKVTLVKCPQLTKHGYRCYEHNVVGVDGVEEIGGLRFFLWDNTGKGQGSSASADCGTNTTSNGCPAANSSATCRELCLYKKCSGACTEKGTSSNCTSTPDVGAAQSNCTNPAQATCVKTPDSQLKPVTTSYTTCKGNVYVFFYGDDPRPLMLCYGGSAYSPRCLGEYDCKWVCLGSATTTGGVCTVPPQVLTHLYKVSMFLNPVKLGLTRCAFKKEKPGKTCVNGENSQAQTTQGNTPYKYPIHQFNTTCVKIAVSPTDLSCYRQYTHAPEKTGFRLGTVSYATGDEASNGCKKGETGKTCMTPTVPASTTCPTTPSSKTGTTPFCFPYCSSKQLIGVALYYYMYDCCHQYPLIVELQFINDVSEYYRLVCNNGGSEGKKWVRMTDKSSDQKKGQGQAGTCKNGQLSCENQSAGSSCQSTGQSTQNCTTQTPTDKEKCQLDQEFARNAKQIEEQILKLHMASEVDQVDFMALTAELLLLIENRAYQIRKKLDLKWNTDKSNLIMATDKNCHEESMLVYLVGGGGTFY